MDAPQHSAVLGGPGGEFLSSLSPKNRTRICGQHKGRFQTTLAVGTWLIYVEDGSGKLVYQGKVNVKAQQSSNAITLVSR
jgi:hypothetical protein